MQLHHLQLRHLRYFVSIVDAGSFCRAASTIRVAQPALSQQIAELEGRLGVTLLHRSVRGVRPTVAGAALYREANVVLRQLERLPGIIRSTAGEPEGSVGLGMCSTLAASFACSFVEACRMALPKVSLRMVTADSLHVESLIESRALDLCAAFEDESTLGVARLPLFRQRLYLIRPPCAEDGAESVSLKELAALPLIVPAQPNVLRRVLDRCFEASCVRPNYVAEVDALSTMLSAVKIGMANAIIPKGEVADIPGNETLKPVLIDPPIHLTACLLSSTKAPLTTAAEAVQALLETQVKTRVAKTLPPGAEWIGKHQPARSQ